MTAMVVGSGALLGSEVFDVSDSKLANGVVGPEADNQRSSFEMLNFAPGLINRLIVSGLFGKTGEAIKKVEKPTLLSLRKRKEIGRGLAG